MKFGIFYELQLPRPWAPGDEHRLYQNALEQIEIADRCGYDHAWQVEHHFLEEYSHSPVPESFLAAASQRTKQIRLGHGIMQLTTNHPARVAEKIATLDLLSNGRCEFGMGESASITELEPFGVDMENKREIFEEAVRAIMPMFKDGPSEHKGKYFNMPLRQVVPKPLQKPHPPLWVACSQLETLAKCGEWGMGALGFQFVSADAAHAWVHAYYNAFVKRQKKLADYVSNPNMALVSFFMCAPTDEEARERADGDTFFQFALRFYAAAPGRRRPPAGTVNMWDEYQKWKAANPEAHQAALRGGLIGSPETIRRKLRRFQASNIDQVVLLNQAGRNTHEHICESLELFAREVMPEFQAAHPQLLEWKQRVLNREIELEEIDTTAFTDRYGGTMKNIAPSADKRVAAE
ncbi:MAG: LLM class flavin-dependent oxidoreductase [Reyranella sp.]|uniref:LLM class flavin-dependent oxidoreductase n=1 Tax=Reyranella sp. TaxID=1929291 RepID=UPI001AC8B3F0|nr:LLM class flavin-dependent oxidoreductase [Reyranella sp.]MBN9085690.1 LLM class flavin-dependent oxidoreductase [Reyranella sp.]